MGCKICEREVTLRMGVCFDCAGLESLIDEGADMDDKPVERTIEGSDALNILRQAFLHFQRSQQG